MKSVFSLLLLLLPLIWFWSFLFLSLPVLYVLLSELDTGLPQCGEDWIIYHGDNKCLNFLDERKTWEQAHDRCAEIGGALAPITSAEEQLFIFGRNTITLVIFQFMNSFDGLLFNCLLNDLNNWFAYNGPKHNRLSLWTRQIPVLVNLTTKCLFRASAQSVGLKP